MEGKAHETSKPLSRKSVRTHIENVGKGMDRLRPGQSEPTDEQIRMALRTFTIGQWRDLIDGFDQRDGDALLNYLEANKSSLQNWLGSETFWAVYPHAIERHVVLSWSKPGMRFAVLTDPLEVARIHKGARQRNITKASQPPLSPKSPRERSLDEMSRPNHIADKMSDVGRKVTRYKVDQIWKRMKQVPFQDFGDSLEDYLLWVADPKAFDQVQAARANAKPPRDPDPYFASSD